ncbi:hypothetical protein SAMN04487972_10970 [Paracoccus halophilus]|uniref:Uncharacterized protein n=1 Tax=Paracoccus halophilus TaxID=376733 RepID=A0A1I0TKI3_9RHOB|nr:hypothetical protein [Paracoccus halophilus]SFA52197.1 hypothetical protein SAMN04487972_10970 [Paracoccus halophilus]
MSDILLLAGVALGALSVIMAIFSVLRTEPPRGAALTLVLAIALLIVSAWTDSRPFGITAIRESGQRLIDGEISLGAGPAGAPAPDAAAPAGDALGQ